MPAGYPGLPRQKVRLPHPTPRRAAAAATRACRQHHHHRCGVCRILVPVYLLAVVAAAAVTVAVALTATGLPLPRLGAPITITVYTAVLVAVIAACRHRRHMPLEISLRVTNETRKCGVFTPIRPT